MELSDRELFYLIARDSAPTILSEASRAVKLGIGESLPDFFPPAWEDETGFDEEKLPDLSLVQRKQLGNEIKAMEQGRDVPTPIFNYIEEALEKPIKGEKWIALSAFLTFLAYHYHILGFMGLGATVEDSEPANNFGFLKEPHKELYPCAWIGIRMRDEARKAILDHVNKALAENGYPDASKFINYSVYGSGASYNWDEDGDFDMQMWVDTDKYNEGKDEPMTEDDLVADIRRIVQLVNFPSFKDLGLERPDCEGRMLIQYYAKPGTGSEEENLASKPYACFDLELDKWYKKPEPITPEFYGEWFILLEPKAKDIATQASAVLESLERNIVEWSFWSQMYEKHNDERFKQKADEAQADAEADKEGAHNMFLNIFQGRAKAYSPEGEGQNDERDLLQKLLEVWGIFQRLRHATKEPLPWEEQELPELPVEEKAGRWHFEARTPDRVAEAVHSILSNGGGTFNLDLTPANYKDGYYSSVAGYEQTVLESEFGEISFKGFLDAIEGHPDYLIGAWVDNGLVYLDLTKHIPDRATAIEFGIYNAQKAIWDIANDEAIDLDNPPDGYQPSPAFAKVAAWKDLMEKAKRLKDQGRVHILNNQPDHVVGRVEGDHGTYTTQIWRQDPNSQAITMWDCECPWDQYAWQRTRQWKKYEGRPCSHTLALFWTAQQNAAQQPQVSPDQMQLPGMTPVPQAPPPVPYQPGAPNLEGQGLPRPGTEPQLPRGPWEPTPQQPLQTPPVGPPGGTGAPPVPLMPGGMQVDPRTLRTAPGSPDPRWVPPAQPGGNSQPQQPGEGGNFGFPGAFSNWHFRTSAFENGTIVQALQPLVGMDRDGRQWRIPQNSKGEVLSSDEDKTIAIFPLSGGNLTPHLVRVVADTLSFKQTTGSPFIGR